MPSLAIGDLIRKAEKDAAKAPETPEAKEAFSSEQHHLDRRKAEVEIQGEEQNISERKKYALYFFRLACAWVIVISALLFFDGFGRGVGFQLSDRVLLAAIGSTTVNIIGILYVVANYLFKKT